MPVSMFSSENSALRNHGRMIARWNSTRDKLQEDERKMSMSEMTEMDGTGLHERENWPLAASSGQARSVSPETVEDHVDDRAVLRRSEDVASPAPDADWKDDDEEEEEDEDEEDGVVSDLEDDGDDLEMGAEPTLGPEQREFLAQRQREQGRPDSPSMPQLSQAPPVRYESQDTLQQTMSGASAVSAEVDEQGQSPRSGALQPPKVSPVRDGFASPSARHSADIRRQRELVQRFSPDTSPQPPQGVWPSPNISRPSVDGTDDGEDDYDEARDAATPIAPAEDVRRGSESSAAQVYSQPTTNGHGRPSSIAKGPLQRSSSRASSHYTTAHIPSNKDRVRYSWQSIQDDEPNRPRIHIIKLVSEVATASAGFPGGEAFGFSISPGGRRIAAYNSARLYVLQTAALPVGISQDYALKRRPLAVEIVDEGLCMAILADEHTINVYDLGHARLRKTKTIKTDFPTNCIALAATGGLLAAAYEGGVEIFSLSTEALPTDRRAVRSQRMDRMCFSEDGSTLLGTTTRINVSSTVIVSVPVFPAAPSGAPTHEELKEAWCSELLHPSNIRSSSHATFMRENRASCNDRVFAWNGLADTFGVLNVSDMQYGNIDFPVVIAPPLSTCGGLGAAIHSCPAIDEHGDTVAMIVNDRTIRLYIVPHKAGDDETTVEAHSIDHELDEGYGCPFSEVRWVYSSSSLPAPLSNQTQVQGRLIVTSPGGVAEYGMGEEMVDDIEGGRIILFDFDPQFAGQPGQTFSLTLGKSPPQMLEEEQVNVAEEVALVRRRTVNQSKGRGLSQRPVTLGRAATTFNGGSQNQQRLSRGGHPAYGGRGGHNRQSIMSVNSLQSEAARSLPDLLESNENGELAMEEPYVQGAPRSGASMQRAASNAQRHRFQTLEERTQERISVDSSGNFLPLPEYTEEPNAPLPSRFRAMAGLDAPPQPPPKPSIMTSQMNGGTGPSPAPSGPATAPASTGETFSAEEAFRAAAATYSGVSQQRQDAVAAAMQHESPTGTMPTMPMRSDTFQSMRPMPRSLQRAYSNAIAPLGSGPPPSLIGDWENVSPIVPSGARQLQANGTHRSGTSINGSLGPHSASTVPEDEPWDAISPSNPPQQASSPFSRAQQASGAGLHRYSTSLLNPSGHAPIPDRAPSNASSYANSTSTAPSTFSGVSTSRRMPPHMQAFRNAAAASAAASLFPPTQQSDQIPVRGPPASAGAVAHPIMAWHPPAPSIQSMPPPSSARGHSRKSSLAGKSAFASTEKAKKLGFFKSKKKQPFMPGGFSEDGSRLGGGGESMLETRSMMTWATGRDGKCSVM